MGDYNADQDHFISLDDAVEMTTNFRNSDLFRERRGGFFGADAINSILSQPEIVGIRYYYGLNNEDEQTLILVGVKEDGTDHYEGELAEVSVPCPDFCDTASPLY